MPTIDKKKPKKATRKWRISMQANDLLECFVSGLDDVILQIAVSKAAERQSVPSGTRVRVESADIQIAAKYVMDKVLETTDLPSQLIDDIRSSQECLREKCRVMNQ